MAITDYYVDPSIAGDSGAGSSGDPYGDLQYALNREGTDYTRNSTDGDRFNIKAGTAEVLAAALSLTTYGTPGVGAPLYIRGYTTTAGDGGIGEINCNAFALISSTNLYVQWELIKAHNGTTGFGGQSVISCEATDFSGNGIHINLSFGQCLNNQVTNCGGEGIYSTGSCRIQNNWIKSSTGDGQGVMSNGIFHTGASGIVEWNMVSVDSGTEGIYIQDDAITCRNNSVFSDGGTGTGILSWSAKHSMVVCDNRVQGFSTGGGVGIDYAAGSEPPVLLGNNAIANCVTDNTGLAYSTPIAGKIVADELVDNCFALSGADTYANRFVYFAPHADVTIKALYSGDLRDVGAVQAAAGGGTPSGARNPLGGPIG